MSGNRRYQFNNSFKKRILAFFITGLIGISLVGFGSDLLPLAFINLLKLQPATAQARRPESVAVIIYQRLPYIPKENNYISRETEQTAPDNTLISRLIRYHESVKVRSTQFRLDWQLTLADYLGANEVVQAERYPGSTTLKTNPLEGDRQAIGRLNRRQRSELVDVLVSIYNPNAFNNSTPVISPSPKVSPVSTPPPSSRPSLSQPGDADLLKF